jgi:hypothetical protein
MNKELRIEKERVQLRRVPQIGEGNIIWPVAEMEDGLYLAWPETAGFGPRGRLVNRMPIITRVNTKMSGFFIDGVAVDLEYAIRGTLVFYPEQDGDWISQRAFVRSEQNG